MLSVFFDKIKIEAGCDEAGRGCLAGPVVAAAVILPKKLSKDLRSINDSKKLTEKDRKELKPMIEKHAISFSIGLASHHEIDEINILNASFLAMHRAIDGLVIAPELLLIDGNRFKKYKQTQHKCIVKGDGKFMSNAAASILAKTYRDNLMENLHEQFPIYDWKKNKAYPTAYHRKMIEMHGISEHHRLSFSLMKNEKNSY